MGKYGKYFLEIEGLPAQKKNRLIFKRPIDWKSETGGTMRTFETALTLDLAPLQEKLVMEALSLFREEEPGKKGKEDKKETKKGGN